MSARKSQHQQFSLTLGTEQIHVLVSASLRKSLKLQISPRGELDVRVPLGISHAQIVAFVRQHEQWIMSARQRVQQKLARQREQVWIRGRCLPIERSALDQFLVTEQQVWVPSGWSVEQVQSALERWLKEQARNEYLRMIERWWPILGEGKTRPMLRIKKMRTRWGSLSSRGYINLNLSLMQLPEPLLELVVVHELCHLHHFDHGAGFKALMKRCLPDWTMRERELKQLAQLL